MINRVALLLLLGLLAGCSTFTPDAKRFWGSVAEDWPTCSDPCHTGGHYNGSCR